MSYIARLALILGLIASIAAGALAYTNELTAGQIAAQVEKATQAALSAVLPDAMSFESAAAVLAEAQETDPALMDVRNLYIAQGVTGPVGMACDVTVLGYGGSIQLMVGVDNDGVLSGIKVISAEGETPGLGAKIKDASFQAQFAGKDAGQPMTLVKVPTTSQSEVQAIAAATISSSAVLRAVNAATGVYRAVAGGDDRLAKLKEDAVKALFPTADAVLADPETLTALVAANPALAAATDLYYAMRGEDRIGTAVAATGRGYGGLITAVVGFEAPAKIVGARFVDLPAETVGLGSKITEAQFTDQFTGVGLSPLRVTKTAPGANEIQAVTSATLSSQGAVSAVNAAMDLYRALPDR